MKAWPGRPDSLFLPWTRIGEVLEWILFGAGGLTDLELNLEKLSFGGDLNGILPLPRPLPWPSLRALRLRNGDLDSAALAHCLEVTSGTLTQLHLNQMRLGPGSWAEVIDHLRDCCSAARGRLTVRIRPPEGGEFGTSLLSDEDREYLGALFVPGDDGLSAVDNFVQGLSEGNPSVEAGRSPVSS